jgi:hypothetical protein
MNNFFVTVFSSLVVALILAVIKAFVDIRLMRNEIDRLEKDRLLHEQKNNESFRDVFSLLREIETKIDKVIGKLEK